MSAPIQGRIPVANRRRRRLATVLAAPAALTAAVLLALLAATPPAGAQQLNFKPLERGEFTEVEERVMIARGLEVSADVALHLRVDHGAALPASLDGADFAEDLRLNLDTVFHRDIRVHLGLQVGNQSFDDALQHTTTGAAPGRLSDALPLALGVREAYLRYDFNPRSGAIMGKQELSLGDRRGKVFTALVPGFTLDCTVGTWCMPFGIAQVGPGPGDAISHWALQYTAYDIQDDGPRRALQVELFRLRYAEGNVPLGTNLGPAFHNPSDPTTAASADASQLLDPVGEPIYYDAAAQDYYGFRVNWQSSGFFVNIDYAAYRGRRDYHLYRPIGQAPSGNLDLTTDEVTTQVVRGNTIETEVGYRWSTAMLGLRVMTASGDPYQAYANGQAYGQDYDRNLKGYYEIVPGSYTGTRLWFNGANSEVSLGGGLGHSINNTRLVGVYGEWRNGATPTLKYEGGLYSLGHNESVPNTLYELQSRIGVEWDNMFTWYAHKALRFEFEANGIYAGGALRADDYTLPAAEQQSIYQVIARVVYAF